MLAALGDEAQAPAAAPKPGWRARALDKVLRLMLRTLFAHRADVGQLDGGIRVIALGAGGTVIIRLAEVSKMQPTSCCVYHRF